PAFCSIIARGMRSARSIEWRGNLAVPPLPGFVEVVAFRRGLFLAFFTLFVFLPSWLSLEQFPLAHSYLQYSLNSPERGQSTIQACAFKAVFRIVPSQ